MSIFGPSYAANKFAPNNRGEPMPMARSRRRSMFGGPARGIFRREDGDPGTVFNHFLYGLNGVRGMREDAMQRDLFGMRVRQNKLEEASAEDERARREAALQALPEELRTLAPLLTNEAISGAVMPRQPEYEIDAQGRPYTIQNGRVQFGEGQIAVPRTGAGANTPPAGYRFTPDGNLEAIPGGPADIRATAQGQSRRDMLDSSSRNLENAIGVLEQAEASVNNYNTGMAGQVLRGVGGSAAYDLNQALEPVRAILSFENLAEMRRNSATGGALGSIAVRELDLLGSTVRSLDTAQSPAQVRRNLQAVRQQLQRTRDAIAAARAEADGAGQATQGGEGRVIDLEP